ncbi:MAG: DUF2304 family protein, partial [bacterium]|nr:DUF2304 family protein [bacterium]
MPTKQILFLSIVFIISFAAVVRMILVNKLREVYAVIWIVVVLCIPSYILFYPFFIKVSRLLRIASPENFFTILGF